MLIESNSLVWSSLASRSVSPRGSDPALTASLETWIRNHLRERALFLPERRAVASFLVLATREEPEWGLHSGRRLRCARRTTWELLCAQEAGERQCAPFDAIEIGYYETLGERLGIETFSARAAALQLNSHPLERRRRVWEILFGATRRFPSSSPEGQHTAAAYRAIREARGVHQEASEASSRIPSDEESPRCSRATPPGATLGGERL